MARLPIDGESNWGAVLNDFLRVSHNDDGTLKSIVNVKDFGAAGDFLQDDSGPIQTAIDTVDSMGNGTVFLPPGKYRLDHPITLRAGIQLVGAGSLASRLDIRNCPDYGVDTDPPLYDASVKEPDNPYYGGAQNIVIKDLQILGEPIPDKRTNTGILLRGTFQCLVDNVDVSRCRTGIHVAGWNNAVVNCKILDCFTHLDLSWPDDLAGKGRRAGRTNGTAVLGGKIYGVGEFTDGSGSKPVHPPMSTISSGSYKDGRVTINTTSAHRLQVGASVTVSNCSTSSYNGVYRDVKAESATRFSAIPDGFTPSGSASNGKVTGQIIGVFVNGNQNSLLGSTIEKDRKNADNTIGVYIRDHGVHEWHSPTKICGCFFEHWRHTFAFAGNVHASITGCIYNYGDGDRHPDGEPVKFYGADTARNIVFLGNAYDSPKPGTIYQNWFGGQLGIGQKGPPAEPYAARLDIQAPWSEWIYLRQERDSKADSGYLIANPWGDSGGSHGDPSHNRLEFAYRNTQGKTSWNQLVLHGPTGNIGIGCGDPATKLDVDGESVRIRQQRTDLSGTSPSAPGKPGEIAWNGDGLYVCVSNNQWQRLAFVSG